MKCSWRSPDGLDCSAEALTADPDGLCWFHSPTVDASRAEARRLGGQRRHRLDRGEAPVEGLEVSVDSTDAILGSLGSVAAALASGRIDRSRANAFGYLLKTASEVHKVHAHEARIRSIEKRLGLREPDPEDT